MGYSSSSPVSYNVGMTHHGGPGTPIIPSPQDGDMNFNMIKNGVQGNIQVKLSKNNKNGSMIISDNKKIEKYIRA
jgi:hypothetical protein